MKKADSLGQALLRAALLKARKSPTLRRRAPGTRAWQAELRIVGSSTMKRLNGAYRGKNYATDVLSFPAPREFQRQGMLGELVICGPTVQRQARERGHSYENELRILIVHGVLHLLGFDHELGPRQAREMARWEARLLPVKGRSGARGLIDLVTKKG